MFTDIQILATILVVLFTPIAVWKLGEWSILTGIIWLLAGLLAYFPVSVPFALISISIGMFLMVFGVANLYEKSQKGG